MDLKADNDVTSEHPAALEPSPGLRSRVRASSRDLAWPLMVFALSRLAVHVTAELLVSLKLANSPESLLASWDGGWYRSLIDHGYPDHLVTQAGKATQSTIAFFPLYPWTVKAFDQVSPFDTAITGIAVATLFGAIATVVLWYTTIAIFDRATARRVIVLFCFLPGAFIMSFVYAESMMVALSLGALLALWKQRWILAGVLGLLATATRPNAIVLVFAAGWAAVVAIRRYRDWASLVAVVLTPLGLIGYLAYIGVRTGHADAWFRVEKEGWDEHLNFGWTALRNFSSFVQHPFADASELILGLMVIFTVAALVLLWKAQLPAVYVIYAVGILALTLASATLGLRPRFVFTAFPLTIALGRYLKRDWLALGVAVGAAGMALLVLWYGASTSPLIAP